MVRSADFANRAFADVGRFRRLGFAPLSLAFRLLPLGPLLLSEGPWAAFTWGQRIGVGSDESEANGGSRDGEEYGFCVHGLYYIGLVVSSFFLVGARGTRPSFVSKTPLAVATLKFI